MCANSLFVALEMNTRDHDLGRRGKGKGTVALLNYYSSLLLSSHTHFQVPLHKQVFASSHNSIDLHKPVSQMFFHVHCLF